MPITDSWLCLSSTTELHLSPSLPDILSHHYHYTPSQHSITTLHHYTPLLHSITTRHHYTPSLHSITTLHHYNPSLHAITTLHHYTPSQHSITTIHHKTLNKNMLKPCIKLLNWRKQPIIDELWVLYWYYLLFLPIQDPYILHILQAAHITAKMTPI